jgi:iron complex transport system substrate-binding protein
MPSLRRAALLLLILSIALACDRRAKSTASATGPRKVASLVPAATDMLLGMGLADRLVAVSNYESSPLVKSLPRVGDYQSTDWETLARLRPDVMVIQVAPDRLPPGLQQHADQLGIQLVNVKIDRLEDVFDTMQRLGAVAGDVDKGRVAVRQLRERLDRIRDDANQHPPLKTLIVRDENGRDVIGPDNYLDDLLRYVNATNAAAPLGKPYPTIDREKLVALAPDAVVVLLPSAQPQSLDVSRRFWQSMTDLPAVTNNKVVTLTAPYALIPGPRLAELAQQIADALRPPPTTQPGTK